MTILCILLYISIAMTWFCFDLLLSAQTEKNFEFKTAAFIALVWFIVAIAMIYTAWKRRDEFAKLGDV